MTGPGQGRLSGAGPVVRARAGCAGRAAYRVRALTTTTSNVFGFVTPNFAFTAASLPSNRAAVVGMLKFLFLMTSRTVPEESAKSTWRRLIWLRMFWTAPMGGAFT